MPNQKDPADERTHTHARNVAEIRKFNRTYLPFMSLLEPDYLGTGFSLTESRVLFEIDEHGKCSARDLCQNLRIDKGYASRIIKKLEKNKLISRNPSPEDGRVMTIGLTKAGTSFVRTLEQGGNNLVEAALKNATESQYQQLVFHMQEIQRILTAVAKAPRSQASSTEEEPSCAS